ncbi:hypothetical protein [Jannaschia sp. R86511]|uniref:hypothetical protein n=1 Tax=Jannaschia sp. R86511 TaxID=3093853 RepID=UPI0036D227F2
MYAALWRLLPGPLAVRVVLALLLLVAAVTACFLWLFPAVAPYVPFNQQTVEETRP